VQIPVVQRIEGVTTPPVPDEGADDEQPL
jgi:hypothetical protein